MTGASELKTEQLTSLAFQLNELEVNVSHALELNTGHWIVIMSNTDINGIKKKKILERVVSLVVKLTKLVS